MRIARPAGAVCALAILVLSRGAAGQAKTAVFEEIDVQRINIVEPHGMVRLVLASKGRFPGLIIKRKERPHPNRRTAGMVFFDDEGTESGGLIYGRGKDASGKGSSYTSASISTSRTRCSASTPVTRVAAATR